MTRVMKKLGGPELDQVPEGGSALTRLDHPSDLRPLRLGVRPAMLVSATYELGEKLDMAGRSAAGNAAKMKITAE